MTNIDELKNTGLKATVPRLKILEVFQRSAQRHMSAEDVFRVLLQERADVGLATVYRVLTQFEQASILKRSKRFEFSSIILYPINLVGIILTVPIVVLFWGIVFIQFLIGKQRRRAKLIRNKIRE